MFGVTLKLKYPFIAAMIGSAAGSAYLAATKTLAIALGAAGLPGFISIDPNSWLNFGIGMIISIAVAFALTIVLYKRNEKNKQQKLMNYHKIQLLIVRLKLKLLVHH
ncbi:hypothetical protein SD457_16980 [Coprobacillaceae bacterium CR2/5/TPMF4]|nr:hypothetical protein SD457_16980 [Coprobacillaceae bacterium CR2/5/TPMF4]